MLENDKLKEKNFSAPEIEVLLAKSKKTLQIQVKPSVIL